MKSTTPEKIGLLRGLLERYSPTGSEADAVAFLVAQMQTLGYSATTDSVGNAVGTLGSGPNEIVLLGHIDTVPGEIPIRIEENSLFGRGAVDAKGPLAAFIMAASECQIDPEWRITVVGAVGEEGDSRGARYLASRKPPAAAIIGEPSGWDRIAVGYKGSAWLQYRVVRGQTHTASGLETACEAAVAFWNRLQTKAEKENMGKDRVFEQVTPVLREMNSSQSGFDQTAVLKIGIRLPETLGPDQLNGWLCEIRGDGEITYQDSVPAFRADKNTFLVRSLVASIRQQGGTPGFTLKSGTADLNLVAPAWNCPAVAYGPGDSHLDHTPDEHIQLDEYLRSITVLAGALEKMMA